MLLPQINIQSSLGQTGLRTAPDRLQIHSQQADLSIQSPEAALSIQYTRGDLEIDQTQAFNQEGLKGPLTLTRDESAKARQAVANGIVDRVQWGDRFADLAHHSANIGQYVMRYRHVPQITPALVPAPFSVHISYKLGHAEIQAQPRPVHIMTNIHQPQERVQLGRAQAYLAHPPTLQISSPPVGQLVDTKI